MDVVCVCVWERKINVEKQERDWEKDGDIEKQKEWDAEKEREILRIRERHIEKQKYRNRES